MSDAPIPAKIYKFSSDTEAKSERAAMRKYPLLGDGEALIGMLYAAHADDLHKHIDPLLKSPDWPERLAEQCAAEARAYVQPDFFSKKGDVQLLPDETFTNYHLRREVMKHFNALVAASDERSATRYPEMSDPQMPLKRQRSEKAALLRANQPDFFDKPDWPERLTELCLKEQYRITEP